MTGIPPIVWIALALAIIGIAMTRGKKKQPKAVPGTTGDTYPQSGWYHLGPNGTKPITGTSFDIPAEPSDIPRMVMRASGPLTVGDTLSMSFTVIGGPFRAIERPDQPASVTLIIQRKSVPLSDPSSRWYSRRAIPLAAGSFNEVRTLNAAEWMNVNGQSNPQDFAAALGDVGSIGLGFGSENGRAHGISSDQLSTFQLLQLEIS